MSNCICCYTAHNVCHLILSIFHINISILIVVNCSSVLSTVGRNNKHRKKYIYPLSLLLHLGDVQDVKTQLFQHKRFSLAQRCESPYLLQYFSDARSHLLKGLRGELIFTEILQDLGIRIRRDTCETI